jgi:ubiquinone/menaquinone biosynthesis C-methylase UbiE
MTFDWEDYWGNKEGVTASGKVILKFREKLWNKTFIRFVMAVTDRQKLLEAGSGSALSSIILSKLRGDAVTVMDISGSALRKAEKKAKEFGVQIRLVKGDLYHIPFSDKAFDLAWNSGTLEHFTDPAPVLKEMRRVARQIICIVPTAGLSFSILNIMSYFFGSGFKAYFSTKNDKFYSMNSFSQLLKHAGFENIYLKKMYCFGVFPYIGAYCKD